MSSWRSAADASLRLSNLTLRTDPSNAAAGDAEAAGEGNHQHHESSRDWNSITTTISGGDPSNHHSHDSMSTVAAATPTAPPVPVRDVSMDWTTSAGFLESWSTEGGFLGGPIAVAPPFAHMMMSSSSISITTALHHQQQQQHRQLSTSSLPQSSFGHYSRDLVPATYTRNLSTPTAGPHRRDNHGVSSIIHDAARLTDWDQVLELCRRHPAAAAYAGPDGWTALHQACNKRCPRVDVVQALIAAYPAALLQEEVKSWLPLHLACRFKAPVEVVRLLLMMVPESGKIAVQTMDKQKRRPLYYAIRYDAPDGVASLLIHVDPSAVLEEDQNEDSPLALVWDSWAEKLEGKRIVHSFLPGGFPEPEESPVEQRAMLLRERLEKESKLKKRWEQVNMLLKAAFGFPVEEEKEEEDASANNKDGTRHEIDCEIAKSLSSSSSQRTWRIVHATAATKCHLSLFLLACALHPEQAREMDQSDLRRPRRDDETSSLPMSNNDCNSATGEHAPTSTTLHSDHPPPFQTALHLAASSNAGGEAGKTVIVSLLRMYREAAQEPDGIDGSLPLHRMVENQYKDWPNHSAILYHFYPRAVQIPDHHGKLPLHRAACTASHFYTTNSTAVTENHINHNDEDRSVIIQLVRSYPQAAGIADESGGLPLHYAAMKATFWDGNVEAIYNSNRNAVQVRAGPSWYQRLPIHLAAAQPKARESLVQKLVQHHPRGAAMEDRRGMLPLHLACEIGKAWGHGTRYIYDAFPQAIRQVEHNVRGWLPLHMAAACPNEDGGLIAKLTEHYPEAASVADEEGRYPLHLACRAGKNWDGGLQVLFDANPNALASRDRHGFLPVHICALSFCRPESDKPRTKAVPMVEAKKERTVNHEEAAQLDILFNLFRSDPTTIQG